MKERFILRNPVLDAKQALIGYELAWHGTRDAVTEDDKLIAAIAEAFGGEEVNWSAGMLFADAGCALLDSEYMQVLPARRMTLGLPMEEFTKANGQIDALREQGMSICLRDAEDHARDGSMPAQAAYFEARVTELDAASIMALCNGMKQTKARPLARGLKDWKQFDSCAAAGIGAFSDGLWLKARPDAKPSAINPGQTLILQLMDMVRKNADLKQIEAALKRDAALSYKLLRYINSSGFGLNTEIQSLRHAVSLLGYAPLYRWLGVLLAAASTSPQSQALMQGAIVRGRFAELIGRSLLPKSEAENLFVAGMFSLLDKLFGVPMDKVLERVQLSDDIKEALLTRSGVYGPFLLLAEACEDDGNHERDIQPLADALFINPRQVNQAHLEALRWTLELGVA